MSEELFAVSDLWTTISDKSLTFYTGVSGRPGVNMLCGFVEYTFFHPRFGPRTNDDFHIYWYNLGDVRMMMFGVPKDFERQVSEIATKLCVTVQVAARQNVYVVESGMRQILHNHERVIAALECEKEIMELFSERGPVITPEEASRRLWNVK